MHLLGFTVSAVSPRFRTCRFHIIQYHLFSFRGSLQDYKIHMDMVIVKKRSQYESVQQF
jgi:hypothetical protein